MNIRRLALFGAISLFTVLGAAESNIEFAGVITAEGRTRIALTDKTKKTTSWVEPGEQFNGYTVARYDAKEEAVFLKKGAEETRIGMVTSKTAEARPVAVDPASPSPQAATTAIRSNLRQLVAAARQYQLERRVSTVGYTDLVGPDKLIKELKPVAGENYSTINFGPNVTAVSVTASTGVNVTLEMPPATATPAPSPPAAPTPPR